MRPGRLLQCNCVAMTTFFAERSIVVPFQAPAVGRTLIFHATSRKQETFGGNQKREHWFFTPWTLAFHWHQNSLPTSGNGGNQKLWHDIHTWGYFVLFPPQFDTVRVKSDESGKKGKKKKSSDQWHGWGHTAWWRRRRTAGVWLGVYNMAARSSPPTTQWWFVRLLPCSLRC